MRNFKSELILLLVSIVWGAAFVAQRAGMENVGPFLFNGIRFAIGALPLIIYLFYLKKKQKLVNENSSNIDYKKHFIAGAFLGCILFLAATLQQIGIVYTTAGKAGFITGLYVVLVPILGLFWRDIPGLNSWLGAVTAALGTYFLCIAGDLSIEKGDFLVLIGSFMWAIHVVSVDKLGKKLHSLLLAVTQFVVCAILSLIAALIHETNSIQGVINALIPLMYGGLFSVSIGFTLQVVGQKNARPTQAAIILSLESVFAVLAGWFLLQENLSSRAALGCLLMLGGFIISQLKRK